MGISELLFSATVVSGILSAALFLSPNLSTSPTFALLKMGYGSMSQAIADPPTLPLQLDNGKLLPNPTIRTLVSDPN